MRKYALYILLAIAAIAQAQLQVEDLQNQPSKNEQYLQDRKEGKFPRHYIEVAFGDPYMNMMFHNHYSGFMACNCNEENQYPSTADRWTTEYTYNYRSKHVSSPFAVSLTYYYSLRNWLQLGGTLAWWGEHYDYRDARSNYFVERRLSETLTLMPAIRFQYYDRRVVGIYSGLAAGIMLDWEPKRFYVTPAWQITAFGLRVGTRVYWNMEVGAGMKGFFSTGIGTRFE